MIAGDVHGKLTALAKDTSVPGAWRFRCVCGTTKTIGTSMVRTGRIRSCGCQRSIKVPRADPTHPKFGTPLYLQWMLLVGTAHRRGGLDPRWQSFDDFETDIGAAYAVGRELVRHDRAKAYGPGNCGWRTPRHLTHLHGQTIGGQRVLRRAGRASDGTALWLTRCTCGEFSITTAQDLRAGNVPHMCSA